MIEINPLPAPTPTRFESLGYQKHAPGLWRIVDLDGNAPVGPHYRTKAELLSDLDRYGSEYNGCKESGHIGPCVR